MQMGTPVIWRGFKLLKQKGWDYGNTLNSIPTAGTDGLSRRLLLLTHT